MDRVMLAFVIGSVGCHSSHPASDAARQIDARSVVDAGLVDAPAGARTGLEITPASGRLKGGVYTLDVEVGHASSQGPATGGGKQLEGNAPIKP